MKKHGIELVCFDLNKTLINETTWDDLNVAMGMTKEEDQHYLNEFNQGRITYRQWMEILLRIYKQRGKANLETITQSVSHYSYRDGAKELVEYLKGQGYHLALISGSLDILVDRIAKELSIELAEANNIFVFDENGNLQDIATFDEDDLAKLRHLESFCRKLGININQCACIGDGDNDIKLFEQTGHGITFKDSKIESTAWQTIENLGDIQIIL